VSAAIFSLPAGLLADRTSKKLVLSIGFVLFGIVGIVGSQSQTLQQGILVLIVIGGVNCVGALINPLLTDLVPRKRMGEFVGLG